MQIIKKVLNSSVVLVTDERGVERVLLGKGIGFGAKEGAEVPEGVVDRVFVALDSAEHRDSVELLAQIPGEFVDLARAIVARAAEAGLELDAHVYIALADHLHFAVERQRRGLRLVNRLAWELEMAYPTEYGVGLSGVEMLRERFGPDVPDEEAANIAFHLASAGVGHESADALQLAALMRDITAIVSNSGGIALTGKDPHTRRFLVHVQFFVERLLSGVTLPGDDDLLYRNLSASHPGAIAIAERVRTYVRTERRIEISDEEVGYLAVHIARAQSS